MDAPAVARPREPELSRTAVAALELVTSAPTSDRPAEPEQLVLRMLEIVRDRVESIHASQRTITEELRTIKTSLPMQRKPLSRRTQAIHIQATLTRRNGLCPCCQEEPVCNEHGRLAGAEYDHFFARDKNRVSQTWLVCGPCNQKLIDTDYRAAARSAFEAYQAAVRPVINTQGQFSLSEAQGKADQ
jgi:hypothetical protein